MALITLAVLVFWGRRAKRKKQFRREEAEKIANLPPDLQQFHIYANQQTQQLEFSFVIFFIICIFIAALIYFYELGAVT